MPTNDPEINQPLNPEHGVRDAESPGYETTDANVKGVAVFLAGLFGSVLIFFVFAFVLGRSINSALEAHDGPPNRWNRLTVFSGAEKMGKRQDLASSAEMQQRQLQEMVNTFPSPRLDIDDGEQATADLHAREDLLLDHYSVSARENGLIRIPIERAMEIIAQRGLPVSAPVANSTPLLTGDAKPEIEAPLTTGFARTGYELGVIAAREQKLSYGKAEGATQAESVPAR
ncbi:MAG: hypothetical protein ABI072_08695 [Edaphobacter sp.]